MVYFLFSFFISQSLSLLPMICISLESTFVSYYSLEFELYLSYTFDLSEEEKLLTEF